MNGRLADIENVVNTGVGNLAAITGLAAGPTAIAGFIADGIFKAIRLGRAIRTARRRRWPLWKNNVGGGSRLPTR